MSIVAVIFALLTSVVFQASCAPQHPGLPWIPPLSLMAAPVQQAPGALHMDPVPHFGPQPYQPTSQLANPFNVPYQPLVRNVIPADDGRIDSYLEAASLLESDFQQLRANGQECDPTHWNTKRTCADTNTVKICTLAGTYRYSRCPESWNCAQGLGICLRPFRQGFNRLSGFSCPALPGIYPDPHSCKVYHVCDSANGQSSTPKTNYCFWPQVYDPVTQSCQRESPEKPCYRFKCFGQSAVAYPGDPTIYANCSRPGVVGAVSRCNNQTNPNAAYNEVDRQCDVSIYCTKEGNIPGPTDNQYYTCSRVFNRLVLSDIKTCLGDLKFSKTSGTCSPPVESETRETHGHFETLGHWTTEDLIQALQESAFILKEEDDPEFASHQEARKRARRSLWSYLNGLTSGAEFRHLVM